MKRSQRARGRSEEKDDRSVMINGADAKRKIFAGKVVMLAGNSRDKIVETRGLGSWSDDRPFGMPPPGIDFTVRGAQPRKSPIPHRAPSKPQPAKPNEKNTEGTNRYQAIYNLFIEGKFAEALAEKQKADSLFGTNFWSPQLLYIEAVHHIKQKNDSVAIAVLSNIGKLYPASKLKPKADKMIDVLKRRKEIEDYLTALQITRLKEDSVIVEPVRVRMIRDDNNLLQPKKQDSSKTIIKPLTSIAPVKDSLLNVAKTVSGPYVINAAHTHYIVMLLDKVDGTYVNESKNAMARYVADNFRVQAITVTKDAIDKDNSLLIFSIFTNAAEAIPVLTKMRKAAPDELSWLPTNKYSFIIIDEDNLTRLKNTKDINGYKALLKAQFAGTF